MMSAYSVNANTHAQPIKNTQKNTYGDAVLINDQKINFDKERFLKSSNKL